MNGYDATKQIKLKCLHHNYISTIIIGYTSLLTSIE